MNCFGKVVIGLNTNTSQEKVNNNKLIDYIDGAKDWLDKAKNEYSQANPVGGELILNLAQAEIKYAWELSRSNYVSDSKEQLRGPLRRSFRERKFNLILPVAASMIVLLGFGWWLIASRHTVKNGPAFTGNLSAGLKEQVISTGRNQNTASAASVAESSPVADKPVNQSELAKIESVTSVTTDEPAENKQLMGNTTFPDQNRMNENPAGQPNLQPVSKLVIDEEALAREASHSLWNGK
jgi:hypothetical protein